MTGAMEPLPRSFYESCDVVDLARALVGKIVVHQSPSGLAAGRIVETEAYRGPEDLAAHSAGGRRTARTEAMFGRAGTAYMFVLYGRSWAFNIVAGAVDTPHAVLVRAIEPTAGADLIASRRGMPATRVAVSNGPGKLCAALGLDRSHYGVDLVSGSLFLVDGPSSAVGRSPRINIDYAGAWAKKPWRFFERGNRFVSVRPRE
ncbi:MAG: DNA-3-methyladenine glycosylase [Polyangiaceae bacterium]